MERALYALASKARKEILHRHTGLEIGGIASPNAIHFWGNCEEIRQIFLALRITLADCESLFTWYFQKTFFFFWSSPSFLEKIYPFLDTFYVYDIKIRIHCE